MEKYLLDPKAPGAFTSEVMHKVVLNGIDFELPDDIPGATLDDSEVVVPHNYEETERLRQEIKKQKRNLKELLPSISGIPVDNFNDTMTNFVYISDKLKEFYPRTYSRLTKLFNEMDIEWGEIEGTKDIWIRDYMPIQISDDRFIVYNYDPDYLKDSREDYLTDSHIAIRDIMILHWMAET